MVFGSDCASTALPRLCAGTNIGGGTFWGLCKLLTGMDSFDDILALSSQGDNSNVSPGPA
jgi:pantothenate kinase